MELKLTTGEHFDLPKGISPTLDVELFSSKAENVVTILKGLDLPSTIKNRKLLSLPEMLGDAVEHDIEMTSPYSAASFLGTMETKSETFNGLENHISVEIIDILKKIVTDIDISIGSLGDGTTFDWDFDATGNVPLTPSALEWFLTMADGAGFAQDEQDMASTTIYPVKFLTDISYMYWTISVYGFLKKVYDHYSIPNKLSSTDVLFDTFQMNEVYMFIPAKFAMTDDSRSKRNVACTLGGQINLGGAQNTSITAVATDLMEQTVLVNDTIVGTSDASYTLAVTGGVQVTCSHQKVTALGNVNINHQANSDVRMKLTVKIDGEFLRQYDLGSVYNSVNGINKTTLLTAAINDAVPFNLMSTAELEFFYDLEFINYSYYDCSVPAGCTANPITINGVRGYYDLGQIGFINTLPPYFSNIVSTLQPTLTCSDILVPCRRQIASKAFLTDVVDVNASLELTGNLVKDLLIDLTLRHNLGWWMDSSGSVRLTNYEHRYEPVSTIEVNTAKGEKFTANLIKTGVANFTYKNDYGKSTVLLVKADLGEDFNYGDVLKYDNGGGQEDLSINLKSCPASYSVAGSIESEDVSALIGVNSDMRYWGIGNRKQLSYKERTVMYGFVSQQRMDIRLPRVQNETVSARLAPYIVHFENGHWSVPNNYSLVTAYFPFYAINIAAPTVNNVFLGNTSDGTIDTGSEMYPNFEYLFDVSRSSTIEIECVLSHSMFDDIIDGKLLFIEHLYDNVSSWKVMNIDGFMYAQPRSVVKLTLKRNSYT